MLGSSDGKMALFDLRNCKTQKPLISYKGFVGAIKDIVVHKTLPYIISVSNDRFIRVHELSTKNLIYKVSLLLILSSLHNCMLLSFMVTFLILSRSWLNALELSIRLRLNTQFFIQKLLTTTFLIQPFLLSIFSGLFCNNFL